MQRRWQWISDHNNDERTISCTVNYDQAGNGTYSAAPQVTETTTATLASQAVVTVSATSTLTYGGSTGTATASGAAAQGHTSTAQWDRRHAA